MNNNIQVIIKSSTSEMSLNDHSAGIYIVPELNGLTGLPNIRTTSGVNAGYDGGWTTAQNYDARSITIRGTIANEDKSEVERMRRELTSLLGQGKSEQLTLDIVTETGKAYEIQVRTISCEMAMQKVLTRQDFMIQLRADDPLIYDITESGEPVILQVQQALGGFQINFELPLAIGGSEDAGVIDNHGLEEVYPIVKMYGALHSPKIINQTTNQSMQINADLGFAEGTYFDPVSTEDGTSLNFNSPYNAPLDKLDIKGNTTQQTYTGKNLFPNITWTSKVAYPVAESGGIAWWQGYYGFQDYVSVAPSTTYTFSNAENKGFTYGLQYYDENKTWISGINSTTKTFTTPANCRYIRGSIEYSSAPTKCQLELGSTATAYEPYVGGIPAPNPSYPQPVHTTTGYNKIKICGKNLLNIATTNNRGVDLIYDSTTGKIEFSGTPTGTWALFNLPATKIEAGTYALSIPQALSFTIGVGLTNRAGTRTTKNIEVGNTSTTFTIAESMKLDIAIAGLTSGVLMSATTYLQLEQGPATDFEPYRDQSYEVNLGKNLLNYTTIQQTTKNGVTLTLDDDGTITLDGTCGTNNTTFDITPTTAPMYLSGTYTISYTVVSGTISNTTTATKVQLMNNSWGAGIDVRLSNTSSSGTWTRSDTYNRNNIRIDSGVICDNYKIKIQLELGSTATTYAPYFTPIELCKIGTYQDYIYKDGNDWKIYKTIAKKIFNGTETWTKSQYGTNNYLSPNVSPTPRQFPESLLNIISNSFVGISYTDRTVSTQNIAYITSNSIWIRNTSFSTATEVSDYFSNNSAVFYYIMATPTDTVITYAPLIEQLEALASSAKAYAPVTNIGTQIATGNALPILNATYYTDKDPDVRDEVIIDSRLKTITLNGLDIYHLKTPGSEFLMLAPGQNKLILQSDNTSDNGYAEVNYKQGYLSI